MQVPLAESSYVCRCLALVQGKHARRKVSEDVRKHWLDLANLVGAGKAQDYLRTLAQGQRGRLAVLPQLPWHQSAAMPPGEAHAAFQPHPSVIDSLFGTSVPLRAVWQRALRIAPGADPPR